MEKKQSINKERLYLQLVKQILGDVFTLNFKCL